MSTSRVRLELLKKQLALANPATTFTDADLQHVRQINEAAQKQVERELIEAESRHVAASKALETAMQELRRVQAEPAAIESVLVEAHETVELRRTQLTTVSTALNVFRFILQADTIARTMCEARFESYRSQSAEMSSLLLLKKFFTPAK